MLLVEGNICVLLCLYACEFVIIANMNYQDGCTSLIYAAMYDRVDCLRLLMQGGAAIGAKDLVRNSHI